MSDGAVQRFSIIIPTHNYGHFLPMTLDSVLAQKTDWDEIIVVDDASTDETPDIVSRYGSAVTYVRLDDNVGPGGAWAVGLSRARGAYVCKLDADDWHLEGSLDRFAAAFESDTSVGMVAGAVYAKHEDSGVTHRVSVEARPGLIGAEEFRELLLRQFFFHIPGVSLRRSALEGASPRADLWMPHDWEYLIRTMPGWSCFVIEEPVAVYRMHDTSVTRTADRATRLQDDLLRLSDLALDAESDLHLTRTEARVFHTALGETYLRLAPFLKISRAQLKSRLKFASKLHYRIPGNTRLSLILMVARVLRAKVSSFLVWRFRYSTRDPEELTPTPYPTKAVDDEPTRPNG
jgi:glycosyltransferase involved in cell wall biosynthesis